MRNLVRTFWAAYTTYQYETVFELISPNNLKFMKLFIKQKEAETCLFSTTHDKKVSSAKKSMNRLTADKDGVICK